MAEREGEIFNVGFLQPPKRKDETKKKKQVEKKMKFEKIRREKRNRRVAES